MKIAKLAVVVLSAFLLGAVIERARNDQTPCDASATYCAGASLRHALFGSGNVAPEPPVAPPAERAEHVNRFEKYRQQPAPPVIVADDQITRINAEARRKQQVREDAKVQAKAMVDELERR